MYQFNLSKYVYFVNLNQFGVHLLNVSYILPVFIGFQQVNDIIGWNARDGAVLNIISQSLKFLIHFVCSQDYYENFNNVKPNK